MTAMSMPHGDGLTVIRELRVDYPALKILAMSAATRPDESSEAFRLGAVGMLSKPFGADERRDAVAHWILGRTGHTPPS